MFVNPNQFMESVLRDVGLDVQKSSSAVIGVFSEGPDNHARPAFLFESRRWSDGSYAVYVRTGAYLAPVEKMLRDHERQRLKSLGLRVKPWVTLSALERVQTGDAVLYDDEMRQEFRRYAEDWAATSKPAPYDMVAASLREMFDGPWLGMSWSSPSHERLLPRRLIVARDLLGFDLPSDSDIEHRARGLNAVHWPDEFLEWWRVHRTKQICTG